MHCVASFLAYFMQGFQPSSIRLLACGTSSLNSMKTTQTGKTQNRLEGSNSLKGRDRSLSKGRNLSLLRNETFLLPPQQPPNPQMMKLISSSKGGNQDLSAKKGLKFQRDLLFLSRRGSLSKESPDRPGQPCQRRRSLWILPLDHRRPSKRSPSKRV